MKAALGLLHGLPRPDIPAQRPAQAAAQAAAKAAAAGVPGEVEGGVSCAAPCGRMSAGQVAALHGCVGCPAHRELARVAARKSLVLLKNSGRALPLQPAAALYVGGQGERRGRRERREESGAESGERREESGAESGQRTEDRYSQ